MLLREVCDKCSLRRRFTYLGIRDDQAGWLCPPPHAKKRSVAERDGFVITEDHIPTEWCEHKLEHAVNEALGFRKVDINELYRNLKHGDAI